MYNTLFIEHGSAQMSLIEEIIRIKSIAWPYSYQDQLRWMNTNLKGADLHVLLSDGNRNLAYMNLVDIDITTSMGKIQCFGVGNVCSGEKGRGYGKELMRNVNEYIVKEQRMGLLFCRSTLVQFYLLNSWILADRSKVKLSFPSDAIYTMFYNTVDASISIEYNGAPF